MLLGFVSSGDWLQKGGGVTSSTKLRERWALVIQLALVGMLTTGCATTGRDVPSCSNVRGYYDYDVPIGAERPGSRPWLERRVIYSPSIWPIVLAVTSEAADGQWQAGRLATSLLVEDGLWKTSVHTGLVGQNIYDVNFDARAWPEREFTTARITRRTVEIYLRVFGPRFGVDGLERSLSMAALKYRKTGEDEWALCPVRL